MGDLGVGLDIVFDTSPGPSVEIAPPGPADLVFLPVTGPQGPPGAAGGATFTATAAISLSGQRVVKALADGSVGYASAAVQADAYADLWLTTQAVSAGQPVVVHAFGQIADSSWAWTPGPVWLGLNGLLTQIVPTYPAAAQLRQIGTADGPTGLFFNPRPAFVLA